MKELEQKGRELSELSLRTISERFAELPIDIEAPNWPHVDAETLKLFVIEGEWVKANIGFVRSGEMSADEVDYYLTAKQAELVDMSTSGEEWIVYGFTSMRANAWREEGNSWGDVSIQSYGDEVAQKDSLNKMRTCLLQSSKLYMIYSLLGGVRSPDVNETVIVDLGRAKFYEESKLVAESSKERPRRGSYGKANPRLN